MKLGISGHAPCRLEAQNRRDASCFKPGTRFYSYSFCLPLSFSILCALLLHSSLLLTLPFSLSRILSCILSRFLAHVLTSTWCSPSRVVLLLCSHCLLWFHSLTPFLHSLVLVDLIWIDFIWIDLYSLVLLSLCTRGMFSYICMFECFMDVCIIDLGFQKFLNGKTSNGHNF